MKINTMMNKKQNMLAPFLPQMSDDGIITNSELQAENNIFVTVYAYTNAAKGDAIRLHFQSLQSIFKLIIDPIVDFPVIFKVPAGNLLDGIYYVYYTVTDLANNSSTSPISHAVLLRNGGGVLPSPVFTDAINDVIDRENLIANGGTHVQVPPYPSAKVNDEITLYFNIRDLNNNEIPESQFNKRHTLRADEIEVGVNVLVPERYLMVTNQGNAFSTYSVEHTTGELQSSSSAIVFVKNSQEVMLPPPVFKDSHDGKLTNEDVVNGVRVGISYPDMREGDDVSTYLRGFTSLDEPVNNANEEFRIILSDSQAVAGSIDLLFSRKVPENVINGRIDCDYVVTRQTEVKVSSVTTTQIDLTESTILPAPVFVDATNGVLLSENIVVNNGSNLQIGWESIAYKDVVTVFLSGYDKYNNPVSNANFQHSHSVTYDEQSHGFFELLLPMENLLSVGDEGRLEAYYEVMPAEQTILIQSESARVILDENSVPNSDLQMFLTLNAPPSDPDITKLRPFNHGQLHGVPGSRVEIVCDSPVIIQESGLQRHELTLDSNGLGRFHLLSEMIGSFSITAVNLNTAEQISKPAIFSPYRTGDGSFQAVGATTGALADGVMPCSVYLKIKQSYSYKRETTYVRVTIVNSTFAEIVGYPGQRTADILLSDDDTAEIDITNTVIENVEVMLTLPESSGSLESVMISFIAQ